MKNLLLRNFPYTFPTSSYQETARDIPLGPVRNLFASRVQGAPRMMDMIVEHILDRTDRKVKFISSSFFMTDQQPQDTPKKPTIFLQSMKGYFDKSEEEQMEFCENLAKTLNASVGEGGKNNDGSATVDDAKIMEGGSPPPPVIFAGDILNMSEEELDIVLEQMYDRMFGKK